MLDESLHDGALLMAGGARYRGIFGADAYGVGGIKLIQLIACRLRASHRMNAQLLDLGGCLLGELRIGKQTAACAGEQSISLRNVFAEHDLAHAGAEPSPTPSGNIRCPLPIRPSPAVSAWVRFHGRRSHDAAPAERVGDSYVSTP